MEQATTIEPKAGDCTAIIALLRHICGNDQNLFSFVVHWLAYPLQNPGKKLATALLINNAHGSGKSIFFEMIMGRIYGEHAAMINIQKLDDHFNHWASKKRYVVCDGIYHSNKLQPALMNNLVCSSDIGIHRKYEQLQVEQNQMNFVFIYEGEKHETLRSNRRFTKINPVQASTETIQEALAEAEQNGINAFLQFLLSQDLTHFETDTCFTQTRNLISPFA